MHYIGPHPKLIVNMHYDFIHFKIIKLLAFPDNIILMKFHFKKRKWWSDYKCINSFYISTLLTLSGIKGLKSRAAPRLNL